MIEHPRPVRIHCESDTVACMDRDRQIPVVVSFWLDVASSTREFMSICNIAVNSEN